MNNIKIAYHKTKIGELILGSYDKKLCLLDFRYRKMRLTVDNRIKKYLKVDFVEQEDNIILETKKQIDEYLQGKRKKFSISILLIGSDFQKQVWKELLKVNYGETANYLDIAKRINNPKAVRAVASANGANAIALIVPCHRIIESNGGLGGYGGGLSVKKRLLNLEIANSKLTDKEKYEFIGQKQRCDWVKLGNKLEVEYHDTQWGVPVFDDRLLFEMLVLEGAQAGLSWTTILKKRQSYKKAFDNFDVQKVAKYDEKKIATLLQDVGIVRNKLKVNSAVKNAKVFIEIQKEFDSFSNYIWGFVNAKPIQNNFKNILEIPAQTELSNTISKDLKKRGMSFVGPTIIYAFMQAVGIVNDHQTDCFCRTDKN